MRDLKVIPGREAWKKLKELCQNQGFYLEFYPEEYKEGRFFVDIPDSRWSERISKLFPGSIFLGESQRNRRNQAGGEDLIGKTYWFLWKTPIEDFGVAVIELYEDLEWPKASYFRIWSFWAFVQWLAQQEE